MKKINWTVWGAIFCLFLPATQTIAQECGTPAYLQALQTRNPELFEQYELAQKQLKPGIGADYFQDALITIPVVVHIVFNNAAQNLGDDVVFDQLEILNEDFRMLNQDITVAPGVFRSLAADIGIQFCLANVDPDGNPTTGITRTATTHGVFQYPSNSSINDDVKYTATGGIDIWDPTRYLNVWVCDINDGIRGYAPYPGTSTAAEDGVVVDFNNFGAVTSFRGRTLPHEVGHWLNLIHIWGDAQCGDDQVADTPVAETSNGGCPTFPAISATCMNGPNGEMFVNHMDYSDHTCRVMFSAGQRDRMLATFVAPAGGRSSLINSDGCGEACPLARFVTSNFNSDNLDFEASSFVIGWSQISGGSDIEYVAGDSVRMDPGFHARAGNQFSARINACSGTRPQDRQVQRTAAPPMMQCFPNPFFSNATIQLNLPQATEVTLGVFDLNGRLCRQLLTDAPLDQGVHQVALNREASMPPGIYLVRVQTADGHLAVQKVVVQTK